MQHSASILPRAKIGTGAKSGTAHNPGRICTAVYGGESKFEKMWHRVSTRGSRRRHVEKSLVREIIGVKNNTYLRDKNLIPDLRNIYTSHPGPITLWHHLRCILNTSCDQFLGLKEGFPGTFNRRRSFFKLAKW